LPLGSWRRRFHPKAAEAVDAVAGWRLCPCSGSMRPNAARRSASPCHNLVCGTPIRSSSMSLVHQIRGFNALCQVATFLPRSTSVPARIESSNREVAGVARNWRWWGAVEHTRDLPRGLGVGNGAVRSCLRSRLGLACRRRGGTWRWGRSAWPRCWRSCHGHPFQTDWLPHRVRGRSITWSTARAKVMVRLGRRWPG